MPLNWLHFGCLNSGRPGGGRGHKNVKLWLQAKIFGWVSNIAIQFVQNVTHGLLLCYIVEFGKGEPKFRMYLLLQSSE